MIASVSPNPKDTNVLTNIIVRQFICELNFQTMVNTSMSLGISL